MKKKFKHIERRVKNTKDDKGRISVKLFLIDSSKKDGYISKKGNITRSLTIEEAKVSEVYKAIEKALFD